jgi:hypothetical protein
MFRNFLDEFRKQDTHIKLVIFVILLIMIFNVFSYYHEFGYDGQDHKWYIEVLPLDLPTQNDTKEFFSPPLPYLFPSIIDSICDKLVEANLTSVNCSIYYGNISQLFQLFMFLIILFCYIKILNLLSENKNYKNLTLILLLLIPVNYKTFVMIRGEPYVSFFFFIILYLLFSIISREKDIKRADYIFLTLLMGGLGLSRQWGLLLLPGIFLTIFLVKKYKDKEFSKKYTRLVFSSSVFSFPLYFWFYIHLFINYGSITAFNREPLPFNFSNQSTSFYFDLALVDIFTRPIRGFSLENKLFPILYSETWGDYFGYFLITHAKGGLEANYGLVPYLGRVNLLAIIPTLLFIFGIFYFFIKFKNLNVNQKIMYSTFLLCVSFMWIGYMWFVIKYPNYSKGDTIKATFILQLIQLLPFFGSIFVIHNLKNRWVFNLLYSVIIFILIYNIPAMISRYLGGYT